MDDGNEGHHVHYNDSKGRSIIEVLSCITVVVGSIVDENVFQVSVIVMYVGVDGKLRRNN